MHRLIRRCTASMRRVAGGRPLAAFATTLAAPLAGAHEGHGMPGAAHWHATDAWPIAAIGVGLFVWWLLARRK